MIVIGVDVHKHSLTAVAVDELGRSRGELSTASSSELLAWSKRLAGERLWALEDCRPGRPLARSDGSRTSKTPRARLPREGPSISAAAERVLLERRARRFAVPLP